MTSLIEQMQLEKKRGLRTESSSAPTFQKVGVKENLENNTVETASDATETLKKTQNNVGFWKPSE